MTSSGGAAAVPEEAARTPEQIARAAAERDPSPNYSDGRPKMHRHFADHEVHTDSACSRPSRKIRVYVFDAEDLDAHERFLRAAVLREAADEARKYEPVNQSKDLFISYGRAAKAIAAHLDRLAAGGSPVVDNNGNGDQDA